MKRILALLMACTITITACGQAASSNGSLDTSSETENAVAVSSEASSETENAVAVTSETSLETQGSISEKVIDSTDAVDLATEDKQPEFNNLGDPELLQYMKDSMTAELAGYFQSEDYIIENVTAIYYSKEYLEEFAYNSQANIFFGYTLEELDDQFQETRYVFTLGENGETIVQPFEDYDDTYDQVVRNVAIGTGVILICVTVSVATGGVGAAPISMVFAESAKTGTDMALSSVALSGIVAGTVKGIQTGDFDEAVKAGALAASESFKWGAISGAIAGGVSEASALRNASKASKAAENVTIIYNRVPDWRESELKALEEYGGREQVSYLDGIEVPKSTPGATRPDVLREVGDHLEAIEVKNYDLSKAANRSELYSELEREVVARIENLPEGSTQRIVLDVTERNFSSELIEQVTETITERLANVYPNIPIDIMGL